MRALLAASLALLTLPALAADKPAAKEAEPTGIAAFSRHDRFVDARISSGGTWVALVTAEGGRRALGFVDLANRKMVAVQRPEVAGAVGDFRWVGDGLVIAELWSEDGALAAPLRQGELFTMVPGRSTGKVIFGARTASEMQTGSRIKKAERELAWGSVLATYPGDDDHVLIESVQMRDGADKPATLYRLDVRTGLKDLVARGALPHAHHFTDEKGEPRLAAAQGEDAAWRFRWREGLEWQELAGLKGVAPGSFPVGYSARARTLYLSEPEGGGIVAVDTASGARTPVSQGKGPARQVLFDRATGRPFAVEYEPDLPVWDFADAKHPLARALEGLLAAFPDDHVRLLDWTRDGKRALVKVFSDRNPGQFLVVDVEKLTAEPVAEVRPWVKPAEMAEQTAFHIKASDGMWIHGYLTLPRGQPAGKPAPLVVRPHGGPHGVRDHWGYDPEVQLLASQGFAVLQVNFRGSGGYGGAYQEAGYGRWGDRMIEDLLDAVRWAVKKGHVDPARVCTFGASFGGYAAVQAAILAPDLIRCAAGYAGAYDLQLLGRVDDLVESGIARGQVRRFVGSDPDRLRAASPVHNADKLKAKVLLIHGGEDKRVPIAHAEALRDALTRAGRPPEWLVEPREGHGFYDEGARERMYARLVAFLKENAGPAPAAAAPAR